MSNHPIDNLLKSTMENLKSMMGASTVIGDAIKVNDNVTILPVSKVSVGFGCGGGEYGQEDNKKEKNLPFGGGSASGVLIKPLAFIVVQKDNVKIMPLDYNDNVEKLIDTIPEFLSNISKSFFNKNHEDGEIIYEDE